jgi:hypothetical protein
MGPPTRTANRKKFLVEYPFHEFPARVRAAPNPSVQPLKKFNKAELGIQFEKSSNCRMVGLVNFERIQFFLSKI